MKGVRRRLHDDSGISLVELLIAMFIVSIIGSILYGAFVSVLRTERFSGEDSHALAQLRIGTDRLSAELREGKRVYVNSTARLVRVWVDRNRDDRQDANERVTWEIRDAGGGLGNLVRYTDANPSIQPQAGQFLFPNAAFSYDVPPPGTTTVKISLSVRSQTGIAGTRTIEEQIRLRNKQ